MDGVSIANGVRFWSRWSPENVLERLLRAEDAHLAEPACGSQEQSPSS